MANLANCSITQSNSFIVNNNVVENIKKYTLENYKNVKIELDLHLYQNIINNFKVRLIPELIYQSSFIANINKYMSSNDLERLKLQTKLLNDVKSKVNVILNDFYDKSTVGFLLKNTIDSLLEKKEINIDSANIKNVLSFLYNFEALVDQNEKELSELSELPEYSEEENSTVNDTDNNDEVLEQTDISINFLESFGTEEIENLTQLPVDQHEGFVNFLKKTPQELKTILSIVPKFKYDKKTKLFKYELYSDLNLNTYYNWQQLYTLIIQLSSNIYKSSDKSLKVEDIIHEIFDIIKDKKNIFYSEELKYLIGYDYDSKNGYTPLIISNEPVQGLLTKLLGYTATFDNKNSKVMSIDKVVNFEQMFTDRVSNLFISTFGRAILDWANIVTIETHLGQTANLYASNVENVYQTINNIFKSNLQEKDYLVKEGNNLIYNKKKIEKLRNNIILAKANINRINELFKKADRDTINAINAEKLEAYKKLNDIYINFIKEIGDLEIIELFNNIKDNKVIESIKNSVDVWLDKLFEEEDFLFIEERIFYKLLPFSKAKSLLVSNKTKVSVLDFLSKADNKKRYAAVNDNHIIRIFNEILATNVKNWTERSIEEYRNKINYIFNNGPNNLRYLSIVKQIKNILDSSTKLDYLEKIQFIILDSITVDKLSLEPDDHLPIDRLKAFLKAYTDFSFVGTDEEGSSNATFNYVLIPLQPNSVSKIIRCLRTFRYFNMEKSSDIFKKNFKFNNNGELILIKDNKAINESVLSYITEEVKLELSQIVNFYDIINDSKRFNKLNKNQKIQLKQGTQFIIFNYLNNVEGIFEDVTEKDTNYFNLGLKKKLSSKIINEWKKGNVHDLIKKASLNNFLHLLNTNFQVLEKEYSNLEDFDEFLSYKYKNMLINNGHLPINHNVKLYKKGDGIGILDSNSLYDIENYIKDLQKLYANLNKVNDYLIGNTTEKPYPEFNKSIIGALPLQVKGFAVSYFLQNEIDKNNTVTKDNINSIIRSLNVLYELKLKQYIRSLSAEQKNSLNTMPVLEIGIYDNETIGFYDKIENDKALLKLFLFEYTLNSRVTLNDAYHMLYGNGLNMAVFENDKYLSEETLYNIYKRNTAARSPNIPHTILNRTKNTFINAYISDLKAPSYELRKNILLNEPEDSDFMIQYFHLIQPNENDFIKFVESKYKELANKEEIYKKYIKFLDKSPDIKMYMANGELTAQIQDILEDYLKSHKDYNKAVKTLTVVSPFANIKHTDAHDVMSFQFFIERALSYGYINKELANLILDDIKVRKKQVKNNIATKKKGEKLTIKDIAPLLYDIDKEYIDDLKDQLYESLKRKKDVNSNLLSRTKNEISLEEFSVLLMKDVFVGFVYDEDLKNNALLFDKNSTRVLLPQSLGYNSKNDAINQSELTFDEISKIDLLRIMMDIYNIDKVSPPSAIKTNVPAIVYPEIGYWNAEFNEIDDVFKWFSKDSGNVSTLELNYNYYGNQTPQTDSDTGLWASQAKIIILMNQKGKVYTQVVRNGNILNKFSISSEQLTLDYQKKWKELYKSEYLKLLKRIQGNSGKINNDLLIKYIVRSLSHSSNMSDNDKDSFMTVYNYVSNIITENDYDEKTNSLLVYINEKLKIKGTDIYEKLYEFFGKSKITINDLNKFVIPLVFNPNSNKLQSILNSLVTTKLTSKGFKAVLIPDIAHIKLNAIPNRKNLIVTSDEWDPTKPLKDKRIEEGKVKPTQIVVSWNFKGYNQYIFDIDGNKVNLTDDEKDSLTPFKKKDSNIDTILNNLGNGVNTNIAKKVYDSIKANYNNVKIFKKDGKIYYKAFSKRKEVLDINQFLTNGKLDFNKFDKRLLFGFGNRIPVQIMSSITDFEIVGFITGVEKSVIIAPSDVIVRMGSDFDIDTLYSLLYNYKYLPNNVKKLTIIEYNSITDENADKKRYIAYIESKLKSLGKLDDIKSLRSISNNIISVSKDDDIHKELRLTYYQLIFSALLFLQTVNNLTADVTDNDKIAEYKLIYKILNDEELTEEFKNKLPENLKSILNKVDINEDLSTDDYLIIFEDIYDIIRPTYIRSGMALSINHEKIKIKLNDKDVKVSMMEYIEKTLLKSDKIALNNFNTIYYKIKDVFKNFTNSKTNNLYPFIDVIEKDFLKTFKEFDERNTYLFSNTSDDRIIDSDNFDLKFSLLKTIADSLISKKHNIEDFFQFSLRSVLSQNSILAIENALKDDFRTILLHPENLQLLMRPLKYGSFYNESSSIDKKEKDSIVNRLKELSYDSEKHMNEISNIIQKYSLSIFIDAFSDRVLVRDPLNYLFNMHMYNTTRVDLTIIGAMALAQVGANSFQTNSDRVDRYNIHYDPENSLLRTDTMILHNSKNRIRTNELSDPMLITNDGIHNPHTSDKLTLNSNIISLGVDSSKIQVLMRLFASTINLNAYIGFSFKGLNEHWIAFITNQDSIKDLNKFYNIHVSNLERRSTAYKLALENSFNKYFRLAPSWVLEDSLVQDLIASESYLEALIYISENLSIENDYKFNIGTLVESMYEKDNSNYFFTQILSLYNYTIAYELGEALGDFFRNTSVDSKGIGSTYHGVILTMDNIERIFKEHPIKNIGNLYGDSMYLKYNYQFKSSYSLKDESGDTNLVFERLYELIQYLLNYDVNKKVFDNKGYNNIVFKYNNLNYISKNTDKEDIFNLINTIIKSVDFANENLSIYESLFLLKHSLIGEDFKTDEDIITEDFNVNNTKTLINVINSFMYDVIRTNVFEHNIPFSYETVTRIIDSLDKEKDYNLKIISQLEKITSYLLVPTDSMRGDNVIILPTHYKYFAIKYGTETAKNLYKDYFPYKSKLYESLKNKLLSINGFLPIYWSTNKYKLLDMHLSSYVASFFYRLTKEKRLEFMEDVIRRFSKLASRDDLSNSYIEFFKSFSKQEFNGILHLVFLNSDSNNSNIDVYKIFEAMFVDSDEDIVNFANSLLRYWLTINGAYTSYRSVGSIIPNNIYLQQPISAFFRKIDWNNVDSNILFGKDDFGFLVQLIQHYPYEFISNDNVIRATELNKKNITTIDYYLDDNSTETIAMILPDNFQGEFTKIKALTHKKSDLVPYDKIIFINARYLLASLLGVKEYELNNISAKELLVDRLETFLESQTESNKTKIRTLIGYISNEKIELNTVYLKIDNLGYDVFGHKVYEFSHYLNVPIGFSNNTSNIFPIHNILSELLQSEETLNEFKYLYDVKYLDNNAEYNSDEIELIDDDNELSPYFQKPFKINNNTFQDLNEYIIYSLATSVKNKNSKIYKLGDLLLKSKYDADDKKFIRDLLLIETDDKKEIDRFKRLSIDINNLDKKDIINIIIYLLRYKDESTKLLEDDIEIQNIRKKRVTLLKGIFKKHINKNDDLQSKLLELTDKSIVVKTKEHSVYTYFGSRLDKKSNNYEGWNIYGKILEMIKKELTVKHSVKINAVQFKEFNKNGIITINYSAKTFNNNDKVLLLSSINVEQSDEVLNEDSLNDFNTVYITLTDVSKDSILTYKLELTDDQQEIVDELIDLNKVTNENRDEKRIQELDSIVKSFFIQSQVKQVDVKLNADKIYNLLGSKTTFNNVKIDDVKGRLRSTKGNIVAYRTQGNDFLKAFNEDRTIGNPWNERGYGLYKTNTIKEAVTEFISWLIGEKHQDKLQDYRQAIIDNLHNLKGKEIIYYRDLKEPSHATALDYLFNNYNWKEIIPITPLTSMSELTNHSGGAALSDTEWDQIGREFGVVNHKHYREPLSYIDTYGKSAKGSKTLDSKKLQKAGINPTYITQEDYNEGAVKATKAFRMMLKGDENKGVRSAYIIRNWMQVKNADAIFAIGTIKFAGDTWVDNKKGSVTAKIPMVKGGTGYAVQMAINEGKPVYVFDGTKEGWYKYDYNVKNFVPTTTPILTKNFAGIGSRTLSTQEVINKSLQAIRDVYEKTKLSLEDKLASDTEKGIVPVKKVVKQKESASTNQKVVVVPKNSNPNNNVIFEDDKHIYLMNDDQQLAYNGIIKFLEDRLINKKRSNLNDTQSFVNPLSKPFSDIFPKLMWENMIGLVGKGGTGKTTIIKKIISDIRDKREAANKFDMLSIKFAAPTHNAVTVLQESLGLDSEGNEGVSTLASLVYRNQPRSSKYEDKNDKSLSDLRLYDQKEYIKLIKMGIKPKISSYDIIIIDESSMVSKEFINDIIYRFRGESTDNMPIFIFMGDFRQLPPIDEKNNEDTEGIISATLFSDTFKDKHFVLNEVMRTKDKVMHNIFDTIGDQITLRRTEKNNNLKLTPFNLNIYNESTNKSNFDILILKENALREIIKMYVEELIKNDNPDNIFWVHYNNLDYYKTISLYNAIRKEYFNKLGITDISEDFMKYDYVQYTGVFSLKTNANESEKISPGNIKPTARLKILDKGIATVKLSSTILSFLVKYVGDIDIEVDWIIVYNRQNKKRYVEMIRSPLEKGEYSAGFQSFFIKDANGTKKSIKLHYSEYKKYEEVINSSYKTIFDNFKPSYVGSSHTVQGKSIKKIIVGEYNLLSNPIDQEVMMRSLYTMLTRAVEKLIIIKGSTFNIINNQNEFDISKSNSFDNNIEDIEFEEITDSEHLTFTKGSQGIGEEISSKGSDLGKKLTNVNYVKSKANQVTDFDIQPTRQFLNNPFSIKIGKDRQHKWIIEKGYGDTFGNGLGLSVEAWYKANSSKAKGLPQDDEYDFKLITDLITDKLRQYPKLVEEINAKGGLNYLLDSTHRPEDTSRWSSNTDNLFLKALTQAYLNVTNIENNLDDKINPDIIKNEDGLIIKKNAISISDSIKLVEISKPIIETTSYKQTKKSTSFDFKSRWTRLNSINIKTEVGRKIARSIITGKQLNGKTITSEMIEDWIRTGKLNSNYPLYVYTTLDRFGNPLSKIPQEIIDLLLEQGIDVSEYEASYNSVYDKKDNGSLVIHQDNTEQTKEPIITISLGRPMKFITYELQDSSEFNLIDSVLSAYKIAVNLITDKLDKKPAYGDITPSNILDYAKEIDKKNNNNDLQDYVKSVLTKTFTKSIKSEYILTNGTILVFSGKNRNVLHEIVFDKDTDKLLMPQGFPTLKVNKAFSGAGQPDKFESTNDYRVVITLRKITKPKKDLNVLNIDKFLTTTIEENESQSNLHQGQLSLFNQEMLTNLENFLINALQTKSSITIDKWLPKSFVLKLISNLEKRNIGYTVSHENDKLVLSKEPSIIGKTLFNKLSFWRYIVDDLQINRDTAKGLNDLIESNIRKYFNVNEILKYGNDDFKFISSLTYGQKDYNFTEAELQAMIVEIYSDLTNKKPQVVTINDFNIYALSGNKKVKNLKNVMVNSPNYQPNTGISINDELFEITSISKISDIIDLIKKHNKNNSNNPKALKLNREFYNGSFEYEYENKESHKKLYDILVFVYNELKNKKINNITKEHVNTIIKNINDGKFHTKDSEFLDTIINLYLTKMLSKKTMISKKEINDNYIIEIKPLLFSEPTSVIVEDDNVKNLREKLLSYTAPITDDLNDDLGSLSEEQLNKLKEEFANNKNIINLLNLYRC